MNPDQTSPETVLRPVPPPSRVRGGLVVKIGLYLAALLVLYGVVPSGVSRETLRIDGPDNRPCLGTIWMPREAKAVIVVGHGVTSNRGVMAETAKAFAANGYAAVALDFWGHGRSREPFNWGANAAQLQAWFDWVQMRFEGLPVAYLGHSMGAMAGSTLFTSGDQGVTAFVSMGALPRQDLPTKTAIALGQFEELFSPDTARTRARDTMDVILSPFSNHALEPWDPVLIGDTVAWVDQALGFSGDTHYSLARWALFLFGVVLGTWMSFVLAATFTTCFHSEEAVAPPPGKVSQRRWSVNPYRIAGMVLGCRGVSTPPRAGTLFSAILKGVAFSAAFVVLLSLVLTEHLFTCNLLHFSRCVDWLVLIPLVALPISLDTYALERLPFRDASRRFAAAALTRAVPLLAVGLLLRLPNFSGVAFLGMMLCIYAFVALMLSVVHTLATRSAADYRAGLVASSIILAWVISFWFPLRW